MSERLTDSLVRRASAGKRAQAFYWDTEVKGFALRITNRGSKAFVLDYRIDGRQRRITIGNYPDWSVLAARREAADLKKAVDKGDDPMGHRHSRRTAPNLLDLWRQYEKEYLPNKSPRAQLDERSMWEKLILPELGKYKLIDIDHTQIETLHRKITNERGTPVRANRVVEVLRRTINLAIRWEWCENNPASGIRKNPEEKRERYLSPEELARLFEALDQHTEEVSANAIRLLILTGARKSEVLGATWDMFDLSEGLWIKPSAHTKQRREHRVPLSHAALELLNRIRKQATGRFVFPGTTDDAPLTDIKRTWESVCVRAGLFTRIEKRNRQGKLVLDKNRAPIMVEKPNVRIHDLRHSFASLLVSGGASLPTIGAMLGHTQVQTTQRYAHLYDEPLRNAANRVSDAIQHARTQEHNV